MSLFRLLRPVLVLAALLMPVPALAVVITVNGTAYDVQFFTNGFGVPQPDFDDNLPDLTNTAFAPWWGDLTLAGQFATAYAAQAPAGSFDISLGSEVLFFASSFDGAFNVRGAWIDTGSSPPSVNLNAVSARSINFNNVAYAYASAVAVPEIDGNAMVKALFVLFALWLWLTARRETRVVSRH